MDWFGRRASSPPACTLSPAIARPARATPRRRLLVVVRGRRPAADVDEHRRGVLRRHRARAPASPATSPTRSSRSRANGENERRRRGQGEPRRRRHLLEVARLRADRLGRSTSSSEPVKVVHLRADSANDAPERDPQDWTLQGSNDGQTWTTLDTQVDQSFAERFQTKQYPVANDAGLPATTGSTSRATTATSIVQLAEWQLSNGETAPPHGSRHAQRGRQRARAAPTTPRPTSASPACARCSTAASTPPTAAATRTTRSSTSTSRSRRRRELSYLIFPELRARRPAATRARTPSVDLAFTDGTYLSDLGAIDQHGATLSPQGQGASKTLYTNQWNYKRLADRRRRRRQDDRPDPRRLRQPRRARPTSAAGSTTSRSTASRRARSSRRTCPTRSSRPAARTRAAASRAATTSPRPPSRTASTSGRR